MENKQSFLSVKALCFYIRRMEMERCFHPKEKRQGYSLFRRRRMFSTRVLYGQI